MSNLSNPNTDVPSLVLDYFGQPTEQVELVQAFVPHKGWVRLVSRPGTWQAVYLSHDVAGANVFAFRLGNRVADFRLDELEKWARRGAFARPAYPERQPVAA